MRCRLKFYRGKAGLTQAAVAEKVGVTQPTYQRWETGNAPLPRNKVNRLALALGTKPENLLGRQEPVEAVIYSQKDDDEAGYWGEAAFHFRGKGKPLLLTISDHAYSRLYRDLQGDEAFLTVRSMANQTVVIRRNALKDVYLSSEAHDHFGVEGLRYKGFHHIMIPDPGEWAIIEAISDDVAHEDYPDDDIERVSDRIMVSEAQIAEQVALGHLSEDEVAKYRKKSRKRTQAYFDLATKTVWQFSDGEKRSESPYDRTEFYPSARRLVEFDPYDAELGLIRFDVVTRHRMVFINPESLDYLSLPTHAYEAAVGEAAADELDEMES